MQSGSSPPARQSLSQETLLYGQAPVCQACDSEKREEEQLGGSLGNRDYANALSNNILLHYLVNCPGKECALILTVLFVLFVRVRTRV